jgi:hypothetical protein
MSTTYLNTKSRGQPQQKNSPNRMVRATVSSVNLSGNKWWSIEKKEWTYSNPQDQEMTEITNKFYPQWKKE